MTEKVQTAFRLDAELLAALDEAAKQARLSRTQLVADILADAVGHGELPVLVGWIAIDRHGEIMPDCAECGQDMYGPHVGLMSNGVLTDVVCGGCATSGE